MNISLIGMPGSGKSTIGKLLAEKLIGFDYIDTDEIIVKLEKTSINKIFERCGEEYFRNLETKVLKDLLTSPNLVISTGGGIVLRDENINLLKEKSIVIYLKSDINTLYERVKNNNERPLLNLKDVKIELNNLLNEREKRYNQANLIIDTTDKTIDDTVKEILTGINNG